jgi:hypothetical protein
LTTVKSKDKRRQSDCNPWMSKMPINEVGQRWILAADFSEVAPPIPEIVDPPLVGVRSYFQNTLNLSTFTE